MALTTARSWSATATSCAPCAATSSNSGSRRAAACSQRDALSQAAAIDADLVLADPPYDFDAWPRLLAAVRAPFLVAEAGRSLESLDGLAEAGWEATRSKRYGRTWVTFFEHIDR